VDCRLAWVWIGGRVARLNAKRMLLVSLHNATPKAWRSGQETCHRIERNARCSKFAEHLQFVGIRLCCLSCLILWSLDRPTIGALGQVGGARG
jgi:hypothetical protein